MLQKLAAIGLLALVTSAASAMNFLSFDYDPKKDELRFVIAYRGTHANHEFNIEWEPCRPFGDDGFQIFGKVIDSDPRDPARENFEKEVVLSLADFSCRPARVSLGTYYNHVRTLQIPAKPQAQPQR